MITNQILKVNKEKIKHLLKLLSENEVLYSEDGYELRICEDGGFKVKEDDTNEFVQYQWEWLINKEWYETQ